MNLSRSVHRAISNSINTTSPSAHWPTPTLHRPPSLPPCLPAAACNSFTSNVSWRLSPSYGVVRPLQPQFVCRSCTHGTRSARDICAAGTTGDMSCCGLDGWHVVELHVTPLTEWIDVHEVSLHIGTALCVATRGENEGQVRLSIALMLVSASDAPVIAAF